jgi:hypothetical protein
MSVGSASATSSVRPQTPRLSGSAPAFQASGLRALYLERPSLLARMTSGLRVPYRRMQVLCSRLFDRQQRSAVEIRLLALGKRHAVAEVARSTYDGPIRARR